MMRRVFIGLVLVIVLAGFAVAMLASDTPPSVQPRDNTTPWSPEVEEPEPPSGDGPRRDILQLEPQQPFRAELSVDGEAGAKLDIAMNATTRDGSRFALVVRPMGEGTGDSGRGTQVEGSISSPGANGTFVFFARSKSPVAVELTFPTSSFQTDGNPLEPVRRSEAFSLSGAGTQAELETSRYDLLIEVANQGTGTLELVDPRGVQRDSASPGSEGWAVVDPLGVWELTCDGICAGQAQVTVTGYPG